MRDEAIRLNDIGVSLAKEGRFKPALDHFQKSLNLDPSYKMAEYNTAVTYNNLAKMFTEKGELTIAKGLLKKSIAAENKFLPAYSNLVDVAMHLSNWDLVKKYSKILESLENMQLSKGQQSPQTPFLSVLRYDSPKINFINAESWVKSIKDSADKYNLKMNKVKKRNKQSLVRIGYVSDGFRDFPTGHNLLDVINNHNRKKFKIFLYHHGDNDGSFYRKQFEKLADRFVDMNNWKTEVAIQKIIDDNIDILIDLKGHTQGANLEIFSPHPGKVQISWLGFPGTTGTDFIDYAIVDKVVVPKGEEKYWSEKLIYMPDSYRPVDTGTALAKKKVTRKYFNLPKDAVVFSSFNNAYKIEPVMWEVWMNILKAVPSSVLWLWERFPEASKNLKKHAQEYGVDPKRLIFAGRVPKDEHLARIALADIALDTRLVNGHTTTAETIRMGVPVVALYGNHFCSRVSSSVLYACGMNELVTHSLKEYENLAIKLAKTSKKLKLLKTKLKNNLKKHPLLKTKLFTKNLEAGYLLAWDRYKKGLKPKQLHVK